MGELGRRGVGVYQTQIMHDGPARLQFQACSFYCRVFVDGIEIGDHRAGGYVAFWLEMPPTRRPGSAREIVVLADNRFNATTAPLHTGGDFWHFGGLMRSVELHSLPASTEHLPWVWRAHVLPSPSSPYSTVEVAVTLTDPRFSGTAELTLTFDGGAPTRHRARFTAGAANLTSVAVPNPRVWSTTCGEAARSGTGLGARTH